MYFKIKMGSEKLKLYVYHGSDKIISEPIHNGSRKYCDFGKGFYVTTNLEMAKSWAARKNESSYVSKYIIDLQDLSVATFDLNLDWLLLIAHSRNRYPNKEVQGILEHKFEHLRNYDIVIGPTADDRMFDTLSDFFENKITIEQCVNALNSMDLDIQYNIKSEKGINHIQYIDVIELDEYDIEFYSKESEEKKNLMKRKMEYMIKKYRKSGKYFDELTGGDIIE